MDANALKKHSSLKLQIELVPEGCWFSNIRSNVNTKQWDMVRDIVYKEANYRCEICGGKGIKHPVECHEVWAYDPSTCIQSLTKLQALCPSCHEVKHYGFAEIRGNANRALSRFALINNLKFEEAQSILEAVKNEWRYRSTLTWSLDISLLKNYGIDPETLVKAAKK